MIITYYGHSFFTLTTESGKVIAFDPYGDLADYPKRLVKADVCLISHHHFDHDGISCIQEGATFIDQPDAASPLKDVKLTGVRTWHDEKQGALRGENTIFVVEAEGLRIGHAGDLGHLLSEKQIREIGPLDVLMVPVGGFFTIDAKQAHQVMEQLQPRLTIPMHYRTSWYQEMKIAPLDNFLGEMKAEDTACPLLRITSGDISQRPAMLTLAIQP